MKRVDHFAHLRPGTNGNHADGELRVRNAAERIGHDDGLGLTGQMMRWSAIEWVSRVSGDVAMTRVPGAAAMPEDREGASERIGVSRGRYVDCVLVEVNACLKAGTRMVHAVEHEVRSLKCCPIVMGRVVDWLGDESVHCSASGGRANALDGVVVSKTVGIERLCDGHCEWWKRLVQESCWDARRGMAQLPHAPHPVDHRVVRPEDGIECGKWDIAHVAVVSAHPDVDVVVQLLELMREVENPRQREHILNVRGGR